MQRALAVALSLFASAVLADPGEFGQAVAMSKQRWSKSPYGPMLERILPPTFSTAQLPEPDSEGARLTVRYCVQCHNLPNPAMHHAEKWPRIVDRMVGRMRGKGNMGRLMKDMMAGVSAPDDSEVGVLVEYLGHHAQAPLDPKRYPEVNTPAAEPFRLACQQCHVLPDPKRHSASEWRQVVERMRENMQWMNRVVGNRNNPDEPQLRVEDINAFLSRHARPGN